MPLYEYYCEGCHGVFELLRPTREASAPQPCPECDEDAPRAVSNFQAFTFRDGYARKLPDDGTYWHLGQKVSTPINGPTEPNQHPELARKNKRPPAPPTREEIEAHQVIADEYGTRRANQRDIGLGDGAIEQQVEQELGSFSRRLRQTAGRAKLQRRRKPNAQVTARTRTGRHGPGKQS